MKINLKQIYGNWDLGYVLDKHTKSSVCVGKNEFGHPIFHTIRTEIGEATYQLKYCNDFSKVLPLAQCIVKNVYPFFNNIGFVVPIPATNFRVKQPVTELAHVAAELMNIPCFNNMLLKNGGKSLKNLKYKEDKIEAIGDSISLHEAIKNEGRWNVLVIDDLYHTGASLEICCNLLRSYRKINKIYVAALTWREE